MKMRSSQSSLAAAPTRAFPLIALLVVIASIAFFTTSPTHGQVRLTGMRFIDNSDAVSFFAITPDDQIVISRPLLDAPALCIAVLDPNGRLIKRLTSPVCVDGSAPWWLCRLVLPDGGYLMEGDEGWFLNSDGSLDEPFNTRLRAAFNGEGASDASLQSDGKLVFTTGTLSSNPVFRVNPDGSSDTPFNAAVAREASRTHGWNGIVAIAPSGKIFEWTLQQSTTNTGPGVGAILRFNPDGTWDRRFQSPEFDQFGSRGTALPDGSLLLNYRPSNLDTNNPNCSTLIRLKPDGSLDSTPRTEAGCARSQTPGTDLPEILRWRWRAETSHAWQAASFPEVDFINNPKAERKTRT